MLARVLLGLLLSGLIGFVGYRRGALTRSGWLGAVLTGTLVFGFGGLDAGLLLIAFFVSSSLLTRYQAARKQAVADVFAKTGRRDLGQALANGLIASLGAVFYGLTANPIGYAALVGSLAAANADTWATELGVLARKPPRLITTGRRVPAGTSGGITPIGLLAALVGAGVIGLFAALFRSDARWIMVALIAGLIGSLVDSLLGATLQGIYYSERRGRETERATESDGTPNRLVRGRRWIDNDAVNFAATVAGGVIGAWLI